MIILQLPFAVTESIRQERSLNTDIQMDPDEVVMISKDTAYYDDEGRVVRDHQPPVERSVGFPQYLYRECLSGYHLLGE